MTSDLGYSDRVDGNDALPVALSRILDRIMADNPISTLELGLPMSVDYLTWDFRRDTAADLDEAEK